MAILKSSIRALTGTPFVSLVAILSLALGIGANAALYSLFEQMLLRALPVAEPGRLVNLGNPGPKPGSQNCGQPGDCDEVFSYRMFKDLESAAAGFSGIAAHMPFDANVATDAGTLSAGGLLVSGSYFPVLGVRPELGRLLGPADEAGIGESFVVVLSHAFWETRLGADPDVLARPMIVNGQSMTVVGVAPRGFAGTTFGLQPAVFVPITMRGLMSPGFDDFDNRRSYWAYLFARLAPDVTLEAATSEINRAYSAIIDEVEAPLQTGMSEATMERFRAKLLTAAPGRRGQSTWHGQVATPLRLLFAITATVLLIACANVANLLLARGARRTQEMAVRGSLGASRWQLLRQLLAESCLLALVGGVAGLLVARGTLAALPVLLPADHVASLALGLRPDIIGFAALVSLATGVAFGFYPALHATRPDLVAALRASAGQPSGGRSAVRFRVTLVTAQIALSMALLVAAGLFIRSLVNISRIDLGIEIDRVVAFGLSPELNGYTPEETVLLFARTEEALAAIPGVDGVAASIVAVLSGSSWGNSVAVEGFESGPDVDNGSRFNAINPGYFRTMGIPLLAGRELTENDALGAPGVALVNEAFARKFGLDPSRTVGARMGVGGGRDALDIEIVGIVQDAKYSEVKAAIPPLYFRPYRQVDDLGSITFYARAAADAAQIVRAIPPTLARLDPNLPVENLRTLASQAHDSVFIDRMISAMSAAFATLATLLAVVGLYGVLTFTVAQRTREIGVRMALGADVWRVRKMVLAQVGRLTLVGVVIGIGVALLIGRAAGSLLFGLEGHDPAVIVLVALLLTGAAFGAGYLPALRASRIDPMKALRFD